MLNMGMLSRSGTMLGTVRTKFGGIRQDWDKWGLFFDPHEDGSLTRFPLRPLKEKYLGLISNSEKLFKTTWL